MKISSINYDYAKAQYLKWISENYDVNDPKISHKILHTFNVVNNSKAISEEMGLDVTNIELAMLIALLHDIGRFSQAKLCQSFREDCGLQSHAALGVYTLQQGNLIRKFIPDSQNDKIILSCIERHSSYTLLSDGLDDCTLIHLKILRDADKIESFRSKTEDDIYTMSNVWPSEMEQSQISDKIFNTFMAGNTILTTDRETAADVWVSYIAFVFGLCFSASKALLKNAGYVDKLIDRLDWQLPETKRRMETIRSRVNQELDIY